MLRVGLTGNIGAGKSLAASILGEMGAAIVDGDKLGHAVLLSQGAAYDQVVQAFGREFLTAEGELDRRRLGTYVFADASGERLRRLEAITHPLITDLACERIDQARQEGYPMVVVEAALLLRSPLADLVDQVWVVTARRDILLERVCRRDKCDEKQAAQRLDSQEQAEWLIARADQVFVNEGDAESLRCQLAQAYASLIEDAQ